MWRSLVAHLFWEQRVAGSNPVIPTDLSRPDQLVRAASSIRRTPGRRPSCRYSSKSMTCRMTVPSESASKAELRSCSLIVSEMSSSTGSFPSRHSWA